LAQLERNLFDGEVAGEALGQGFDDQHECSAISIAGSAVPLAEAETPAKRAQMCDAQLIA
jgi:hypothetical protein